MTIYLGRYVHGNHVDDHDHKSGKTCKGIHLRKEKISLFSSLAGEHITTDPYRPPVGLTSSDDTPLEVKSGEEFPSDMVKGESN
jgi:hypothetical protein